MKIQIHTQLKVRFLAVVLVLLGSFIPAQLRADPLITSWLTTYSGRYARIYTTDAAKNSSTASTTWTNGTTIQSLPAYCGVQEVDSSATSVYIRSTGFGSHIMGPWYLDTNHTMLFPNYPTNQHVFYRLPRIPTVPANKTATGGGPIGYFVDGVAMFNSWDAYSWNGTTDAQNVGSTDYWNRDAYINEGASFDANNAHQAGGQHHYHANPPGLRYLLGDHVNFVSSNKTYIESTSVPVKHSSLLGWVADGYPVYGPYGYSNATNSASGIRRMISGYVLRNGQSNSINLNTAGRATLPQWAVRLDKVSASQSGPGVSSSYPLGRYMEDNDYLGDLTNLVTGTNYQQGNEFDLDEYNGRYCFTPEYPNGTYAYFVSIAADGTPAFPYNIGRGYYGSPTGSNVTSITETVTTNYLGGPNLSPVLNPPAINSGTVTLTWSATEGGTYLVQTSTNLPTWTTTSTNVPAVLNGAGFTNSSTDSQRFYRVARTALATYDPATGGGTGTGGGGQTITFSPATGARGTSVSFSATISASATPPAPPHTGAPIASFTVGAISVSNGSYTYNGASGTITGTLVIPALAATGSQTATITFSPPPGETQGRFTPRPPLSRSRRDA